MISDSAMSTKLTLSLFKGTTLMTYPIYPAFAPHSVLEWGTYDIATDQLAMKATSPVGFMETLRESTGGWIRFSGGTPGVRLDKDRFIAVGHAVGDLTCFHQQRRKQSLFSSRKTLGRDGSIASDVRLSYHACNSTHRAPNDHHAWWNHFKTLNHTLPGHHPYW